MEIPFFFCTGFEIFRDGVAPLKLSAPKRRPGSPPPLRPALLIDGMGTQKRYRRVPTCYYLKIRLSRIHQGRKAFCSIHLT